jgi:hypothetical protein
VYGNEDQDFNYRLDKFGYLSYYVDLPSAVHAGNDVDEKSEYRQMKWRELKGASERMHQERLRYEATGSYYIPPPSLT